MLSLMEVYSMTEQHPITPPLELVEQWECEYHHMTYGPDLSIFISEKAARWGADQELEACCEYLTRCAAWEPEDVQEMRDACRPKPLSLKEQALQALENADGADHPVVVTVLNADQHALIRRALESLSD